MMTCGSSANAVAFGKRQDSGVVRNRVMGAVMTAMAMLPISEASASSRYMPSQLIEALGIEESAEIKKVFDKYQCAINSAGFSVSIEPLEFVERTRGTRVNTIKTVLSYQDHMGETREIKSLPSKHGVIIMNKLTSIHDSLVKGTNETYDHYFQRIVDLSGKLKEILEVPAVPSESESGVSASCES